MSSLSTSQLLQSQSQLANTNISVQQQDREVHQNKIVNNEIVQPVLFAQQSVRNFRESDFTLNSKLLVALNYSDCILCLFYDDTPNSRQLAQIWAQAAIRTSGPIFAACNLVIEKRVAEAFIEIGKDQAHPFYWAHTVKIPFILVYSSGWPKATYRGHKSVSSIIAYSMQLACQAGYTERESLKTGTDVHVVQNNIKRTDPPRSIVTPQQSTPEDMPPRIVSSQFNDEGDEWDDNDGHKRPSPPPAGVNVLLGKSQTSVGDKNTPSPLPSTYRQNAPMAVPASTTIQINTPPSPQRRVTYQVSPQTLTSPPKNGTYVTITPTLQKQYPNLSPQQIAARITTPR
jgi:hypothetical protein